MQQIQRVLEVWGKASDGAFMGIIPLEPIALAELQAWFAEQQDSPDPYMTQSYLLDAQLLAQIQPYSATALDYAEYDYVLSAHVMEAQ